MCLQRLATAADEMLQQWANTTIIYTLLRARNMEKGECGEGHHVDANSKVQPGDTLQDYSLVLLQINYRKKRQGRPVDTKDSS